MFDLVDIFELALKIFFIRQNADGVCPAFFVCLCDCNRGEIPADDACRGRGLFYFGDDVDAPFVGFCYGLVEIAAFAEQSDLLFKLLDRPFFAALLDFNSFIRDNLVQYGHRNPPVLKKLFGF